MDACIQSRIFSLAKQRSCTTNKKKTTAFLQSSGELAGARMLRNSLRSIADTAHNSSVCSIGNPHIVRELTILFCGGYALHIKRKECRVYACILTRTLLSLLNTVALQTKKDDNPKIAVW